MFNGIGLPELLVIGGIAVLLFGAKRIPEVAKSLGQGIRVFKNEVSKTDASPDKNASEPEKSAASR